MDIWHFTNIRFAFLQLYFTPHMQKTGKQLNNPERVTKWLILITTKASN